MDRQSDRGSTEVYGKPACRLPDRRPTHLTPTEWQALVCFHREVLSIPDIGHRLGVSAAEATRIIRIANVKLTYGLGLPNWWYESMSAIGELCDLAQGRHGGDTMVG